MSESYGGSVCSASGMYDQGVNMSPKEMKEEIEALRRKLAVQSDRCATLVREQTNWRELVAQLSYERQALEKNVAQLQSTERFHKERLTEYRNKVRGLREDIEKYKEKLEGPKGKMADDE